MKKRDNGERVFMRMGDLRPAFGLNETRVWETRVVQLSPTLGWPDCNTPIPWVRRRYCDVYM